MTRLLVLIGSLTVLIVGALALYVVVVRFALTWAGDTSGPTDVVTAVATAVSALTLVLTLGILFAAAVFGGYQVSSATKARNLQLLIHLHQTYADGAMHEALHRIYNDAPESFDDSPYKQKQRRLVMHFFEMLGTVVKAQIVSEDLLLSRFRDAITVWEKLRPVHQRVNDKVIRERHPALSDFQKQALSEETLDSSHTHWLYERWKNKRSQLYLP